MEIQIQSATIKNLSEIVSIYDKCRAFLNKNNIHQWKHDYPNEEIIRTDIEANHLFLLILANRVIGVVGLNSIQKPEYENIPWQFDGTKTMVINRLAIDPSHQHKGYAQHLMAFAENHARSNQYTTIRLDAYGPNEGIQRFYHKRDYNKVGTIYFPNQSEPFNCFEKEISPLSISK